MTMSSQFLHDVQSAKVRTMNSSSRAGSDSDLLFGSTEPLNTAAVVNSRRARVISDLFASAVALVLSLFAWRYASPAASLQSVYAVAGWWGAGVLSFCLYRMFIRAEDNATGVRYRVQETAGALQLLAWGWGGVCFGLMLQRIPDAVSVGTLLTAATAVLAIGMRQSLHSLRRRVSSLHRKIVHIAPRRIPVRRFTWSASLKRTADMIVALTLLFLAAPLMLCIALAILVDSPGPVVFVQRRVGYRGTMFDIYKFRTMHTHAPRYECSPVSRFDRRITRVGRMLRMTSLDELPQLWNVVRGDMSLVGPRPEMPFIVQSYNDLQSQRLEAIPGITGLWQISAHRGLPIHQNIQYDLDYIHMRSFAVDAAILLHTIVFAMRGI